MEPKEKAKELVDKMHNSEHCGIKHFPNKKYCDCVEMNFFQAKQCALKAVDEIIENLVELSNGEFTFIHNVEYWQEVKKEIELL